MMDISTKPFKIMVKNWRREVKGLRYAMSADGEDDFTLGHVRALEKCANTLDEVIREMEKRHAKQSQRGNGDSDDKDTTDSDRG